MKTIAFYQPHLDIQGTGVSYFDYAYHNEIILGNKSFMICDKNDSRSHPLAVEKFKKHLNVIELNGSENMNFLSDVCKEIKADALYIQKCGRPDDNRFIDTLPTFIHVVGVNNIPHGTVYAYVSEWLSVHCSNSQLPFVPYMISLPETNFNLRKALNIPDNAVVFGRTGGPYSWNIPFVNESIKQTLNTKPNTYFLFANTNKFIDHERAIFLDAFADLSYKKQFINTCDAMLHARMEGESFGASCAEFSTCNKPIITYQHSPEKSHIYILKEKGLYYQDQTSLTNILLNFEPTPNIDWNAYKSFTPEKVMQKFNEVFISRV